MSTNKGMEKTNYSPILKKNSTKNNTDDSEKIYSTKQLNKEKTQQCEKNQNTGCFLVMLSGA